MTVEHVIALVVGFVFGCLLLSLVPVVRLLRRPSVHLLKSDRESVECGLSKYAVRAFHEGLAGSAHAVTCTRCLDARR